MPFVQGFLRIRRRGRPGQPLPPGEEPVDPDYGIDEGERPEVEPPDPDEGPPGIWPPPTPGHPIEPLPPETGGPGHLPSPPPGAIWPRPPGAHSGKLIVLAHIPGYGWRYIVIDPSSWPEWTPEHPIERPGVPQPKRP